MCDEVFWGCCCDGDVGRYYVNWGKMDVDGENSMYEYVVVEYDGDVLGMNGGR